MFSFSDCSIAYFISKMTMTLYDHEGQRNATKRASQSQAPTTQATALEKVANGNMSLSISPWGSVQEAGIGAFGVILFLHILTF